MNNKGWMIATICLAVLGLIILLSLFNEKIRWLFIKISPPPLWRRKEEYKIDHFFSTVTGLKNYIRVKFIERNSFITLYRNEDYVFTTGVIQDIKDRIQ
jgi:hypothetical protein